MALFSHESFELVCDAGRCSTSFRLKGSNRSATTVIGAALFDGWRIHTNGWTSCPRCVADGPCDDVRAGRACSCKLG